MEPSKSFIRKYKVPCHWRPTLLTLLYLLACLSIKLHPVKGKHIICSKEEYVTSGIEFKTCQDETLKSFEPADEGARQGRKDNFILFETAGLCICTILRMYENACPCTLYKNYVNNFQMHTIHVQL